MRILSLAFAAALLGAEGISLHDYTIMFREIATRTRPAVVVIETVKDSPSPGVYDNPTWEEVGTGFLIDSEEGLLVTSAQTVKDSMAIAVTFDDGRIGEAKVVGADYRTDVAVLRLVHARPELPALQMAPAGSGTVGEPVLAMGANPEGGLTYSMGIFSARPMAGDAFSGGLSTFMQFDASMNGGMQGGPVLSLRGDVLGVASFLERSRREMFLNFGIPVDTVEMVVGEIVEKGVFEPLTWGIDPLRPSERVMLRYGFDGAGVFVPGVRDGASAKASGLRDGDFIVAIDGEEVTDPQSFWRLVSHWVLEDDESLAAHTLTIWRDGRRLERGFVPVRTADLGVRESTTYGGGY